MIIRPAAPDDAPAIAEIYNHGIDDRGATFETRRRSAADVQAWLAEADRLPVLVAVRGPGGASQDESVVVGWAGLGTYRPRECYAGIAEFSIYVARASRGQGIGRPLLTALVETARTLGYWKLVSRVFVFNAASRGLCRACGFREVGIYEKHARLDGVWQDVVIVERVIAENLSPEPAMVASGSAAPVEDRAAGHVRPPGSDGAGAQSD